MRITREQYETDIRNAKAEALREFATQFARAGFLTHDLGWDAKTIANAAEYAEAMAEELHPTPSQEDQP